MLNLFLAHDHPSNEHLRSSGIRASEVKHRAPGLARHLINDEGLSLKHTISVR